MAADPMTGDFARPSLANASSTIPAVEHTASENGKARYQ